VLAFGLGLGALFLSLYQGYATQATNLLFGSIVGVSDAQLRNLVIVAAIGVAGVAGVYRPLLFSSVDPEIAAARGVPLRGALGGDLPPARPPPRRSRWWASSSRRSHLAEPRALTSTSAHREPWTMKHPANCVQPRLHPRGHALNVIAAAPSETRNHVVSCHCARGLKTAA
jgi:ABC 3 transport family